MNKSAISNKELIGYIERCIPDIARKCNTTNEEVIIRSLKQPNCIDVEISNNQINYTIEKIVPNTSGSERIR